MMKLIGVILDKVNRLNEKIFIKSVPESILPHSFNILLMTSRIFLCSSVKIVVGFSQDYNLYSIGSLADSLIINFAITTFPALSVAAMSSEGLNVRCYYPNES